MKIQNENKSSMLRKMKNSRGNTTMETALLLLPFILMLVAVIEFGWYFLHEHTLQFATREGMRLALVGGVLDDGEGGSLSREDSIVQTIQETASSVMTIDTGKIKIFELEDTYESPDDWETAANNVGSGADYMRVVVSYDHEFFTPLIGEYFSEDNSIQMRAQGTYRNESFD